MRTIIRRIPVAIVALLILVLAGCASNTSVGTISVPHANLASCRTVAHLEHLGTDHAQFASIVSERLYAATTRELQALGFRRVDREPDLLSKFPLSKREVSHA